MKLLIFYRLLGVILLTAWLYSCSIKVAVHIPTDNLPNAQDHFLIQEGIAIKQETFLLTKVIYKSKERKKALQQICELSDHALQLYRAKNIDRKKYDQIQTEAKYVVEQAISRMKGESGAEIDNDDPILAYLKTGIETIKKFLPKK